MNITIQLTEDERQEYRNYIKQREKTMLTYKFITEFGGYPHNNNILSLISLDHYITKIIYDQYPKLKEIHPDNFPYIRYKYSSEIIFAISEITLMGSADHYNYKVIERPIIYLDIPQSYTLRSSIDIIIDYIICESCYISFELIENYINECEAKYIEYENLFRKDLDLFIPIKNANS